MRHASEGNASRIVEDNVPQPVAIKPRKYNNNCNDDDHHDNIIRNNRMHITLPRYRYNNTLQFYVRTPDMSYIPVTHSRARVYTYGIIRDTGYRVLGLGISRILRVYNDSIINWILPFFLFSSRKTRRFQSDCGRFRINYPASFSPFIFFLLLPI